MGQGATKSSTYVAGTQDQDAEHERRDRRGARTLRRHPVDVPLDQGPSSATSKEAWYLEIIRGVLLGLFGPRTW
jgi:hypothetical protein